MKKFLILLFATAIGTTTGNPLGYQSQGNIAYAASKSISRGELNNYSNSVSKGNDEKFKVEFAYEMAQITAKIVSTPITNVENFKIEFAYATAKVTAQVMPMLPSLQRNEFAYEMAQITTKIISSEKLDIDSAKAEFAYKVALLTTKIITNGEQRTNDSGPQAMLLRNNGDIEPKVAIRANNTTNPSKEIVTTDVSPETYTRLVDELVHVGDRSKGTDNKVKIDGEVRYHYASNSGPGQRGKDSSGIRARIAFDTGINQDWRAYAMVEGQQKVVNYDNKFELSHLYVAGRVGQTMVKAGSFGYLMAEGNIYDSGFEGIKVDFAGPLQYTVGYGKTDDTKKTYVATARYRDFDYDLEAGVYHYQTDDASHQQNTIRTFSGNYNFSNFSVGAMVLGSSLKDSKGDSTGYVVSVNYGDLKTFRPGTYSIFAKYYNQPLGTYIAHGMNGRGNAMQGFKGYGLGVNYTFALNSVVGTEYYDLKDKITGEKGNTWWSYVTRYF